MASRKSAREALFHYNRATQPNLLFCDRHHIDGYLTVVKYLIKETMDSGKLHEACGTVRIAERFRKNRFARWKMGNEGGS